MKIRPAVAHQTINSPLRRREIVLFDSEKLGGVRTAVNVIGGGFPVNEVGAYLKRDLNLIGAGRDDKGFIWVVGFGHYFEREVCWFGAASNECKCCRPLNNSSLAAETTFC